MAKKTKKATKARKATPAKRGRRNSWTRQMIAELRRHSKARTPVNVISKLLGRSGGALRQKARVLGFPLGHRRAKKKRA